MNFQTSHCDVTGNASVKVMSLSLGLGDTDEHSQYFLKNQFFNMNLLPAFCSTWFGSSQFAKVRDKTNKMICTPAKTQTSLGICPVWSESLQCTQCVAEDPMFLHADSKNSDQTGRMPRLIWVFTGHIGHFVGFVMRWLIYRLEDVNGLKNNEKYDNKQCLSDTPCWSMKKTNTCIKNTKAIQYG